MFGTSDKSFNAEGQGVLKLEPGIYKGKIAKPIELGEKTYQDQTDDTVDMIFEVTEGEKTGNQHLDQQKIPTDSDKLESFFERYIHILSAFLTKEEIEKAKEETLESKEEFVKWLNTKLKSHIDKTVIQFKVVGSVYNSNGVLRMPSFNRKYSVPFVAPLTKQLDFTNSEIKQNNEYFFWKKGTDSSEDLGSPAAGGSDPAF